MSIKLLAAGMIACACFAPAHASDGLLAGEVDLGSNGTYTGYSSSDFTEYGAGMKKVRVYDWVCPGGSVRPPNGVVQVELPPGQCVSMKTGSLIAFYGNPTSECFPMTLLASSSGAYNNWTYLETISLDTYQCFSSSSMSILAMVRQYRSESYVVGSNTEGVQTAFSHGTQEAARAAGKTSGGVYSSCTANPFSLCSGGRPGPRDAMRACFDFLCK